MSAEPHPLFSERQPGPQEHHIGLSLIETARAIAAICATRILLLIAVITGCAIWGYVAYNPERDRLYAAIAFSLVFVLPQTLLYWRKG